MLKHVPVAKSLIILLLGAGVVSAQPTSKPIQHDAEHYMLLKQHGDRWAQEDEAIAAKLEEVRNANGGKPPNILFVLIDDVGFGEMGDPVLNHVRGYTTPNINALARESMTFPVCTLNPPARPPVRHS